MSQNRPKKLLVYLDQNFISEMAKPAERAVRLDFRELYEVLHEGFWGEKLVVLRSRFHDVETSLAGTLKGPIRSRQSTIGHVDLANPEEIRESQMVASLQRYLGQPDAPDVIYFDDAFDDPPDARVGHFDVSVDMDWMHAGAKEGRQSLATELDTVRKEILERSTSYETQISIEMKAARRAALTSYRAPHYAAAAGATPAEFGKFVVSAAFEEIPIIQLDVSLLTRVMTAHATRAIRQGDVTDVEAMATYLPYCDVYGADRFMADVARSLGVPTTFKCQLFDSRKEGVMKLIEHLREALAAKAPVNVPALSIFVAPNEGIKQNSWSFFHKIGCQSKTAENRCGLWIEVFSFDDGKMPRYELRQARSAGAVLRAPRRRREEMPTG